MTEDILFDNIYVGHSIIDAERLGNESWVVKHNIEAAATAKVLEVEEEEAPSFKQDPLGFVRDRAMKFVMAASADPVNAFKADPTTGGALVASVFSFFVTVGILVGLIGDSQQPAPKVSNIALVVSRETELHCPSPRKRRMRLVQTTKSQRMIRPQSHLLVTRRMRRL